MNESEAWLANVRSKPEARLANSITSGNLDLALELLRDNPHLIHARFSGNNTPLLESAYSGHFEIADRLLAMGAKMDFIAAIALGRRETIRAMLTENPGLAQRHSPDGWSAMHIAARYADVETLTLLLSAGGDVNDGRNKQGLTPLFFAWKKPYANAELLLRSGADIDARGKHGFTVLHYAAMRGDQAFVEFLLAHDASPEMQTNARQTAWALAVRRGHRAAATLLNSR